ncbi:hypothetical protein BV20DRAFT_920830, partial [Pilatotrama ljubarskyi]
VPQCSTCFAWGHTYGRCNATQDVCVHCGDNHHVRFHDMKATCCRGRSAGQPCPHPPSCRNCGGRHWANDRTCEYFRHRNDRNWYRAHPPVIA